MAETIKIIIEGQDKSQGAFKSAIGNVSKIGKIALAGAVTGIAAIGGAATIAGTKLINLGSDAQEMMGKFDVVFAQTGGQVTAALDEFASSVGRSRFELMGMASTFGDTLKPMGFTEQAAADMSVQLTQLATDLGSFNNMEMDEALQRLQGTLIGSHENALAFGVIINENTLKAKLAEMGLDNLTGAAAEQAKVQARLALLMEGTTDAQGDAARTSGSWANQMRGLKSTLTDAATELGLKLLPAVTPLLSMVGELAQQAIPFLTRAFDRLLPIISDISAFIRGFIKEIQNGLNPIDAIVEALLTWTNFGENMSDEAFYWVIDFSDKIKELQAKIQEFLQPIIELVQKFVSWKDVLIALGIAISAAIIPALISIATTIAPIIAAVIALIAIVSLVRNAWENDWGGIRTWLTDTWNNHLQPALMQLWEWLEINVPIALETLKQFWLTVLLPAIQQVWTWLSTVLIPFLRDVVWPWLNETLTTALQNLASFWETVLLPAIENVWSFIQNSLVPLFEALWELLSVAGKLALTILQGIWENVLLPALQKVWEFIQNKVMPILRELWDFISAKLNPILEAVKSKFDSVSSGIGGISGAIQSLIGWVRSLTDALGNVSIPDWMTPGSPTPLEIGLRGISSAMAEINRMQLPAFAGANGNGTGSTVNQSFVWNVTTGQLDPTAETRAQRAFVGGI